MLAAASKTVAQQYPLFSNYLTNSFGFNPAITGITEGTELRLMYRNQWSGLSLNPETALGNVNSRFGKSPIGLGVTWFKDGAGRFNRQGALASIGLHQKLGKDLTASLGGSFGFYKNVLQNQYFAENPSDPILAEAAKGAWAPDMSVGLHIQYKNFFAGGSSPQFLQRVLKFDQTPDANLNESVLQRHYFFFAGYKLFLGKMYIEPSALVKTTDNAPLQWDANLRFGTGTPLWLAATFRNKAAGAAMAGLDFKNGLGVAYAFDLTTSGLAKASVASHELTLVYRWAKCKDTDSDGICDKEDKCPEEPGLKEKEGCPDKKEDKEKCKDADKDDVCDNVDECPNLPGPKENKGCPTNDRDRDGVPDDKDKCPDTPGFKQFDGCPMNDRDNDGIRDDIDRCPDEPGPVSNLGCTQGKGDADGDGIPDELDQCPNTYGPKDKNGCPKVSDDDKAALQLAIQNLYFDTDKWVIKSPSKPHLDRLAKVMATNRDWKVRIAGHADYRGTDEHNLNLSKNRSEATMYYLMARGVKREQLIVEYYGEKIPIGNNKTAEGLQENRRVEMEFVFN